MNDTMTKAGAPDGYVRLPAGNICKCPRLWTDGTGHWCCLPTRAAEQRAEGQQPAKDDGWQWAIVEIFGHRRHAGRIREEERFGTKMLRIDVPKDGDPEKHGWETHWYGGSSIFSLTLTDEDSAVRINKPYELPARYRLPPARSGEDEDEAEAPVQQAAEEAEVRLKADDDGMPF